MYVTYDLNLLIYVIRKICCMMGEGDEYEEITSLNGR